MSKFDKYSRGAPALPGSSNSIRPSSSHEARADSIIQASQNQRLDKKLADRLIHGRAIRVAIALDGTGSMGSLIEAAKRQIIAIIERVTQRAECDVDIELFVYRDYDVPQLVIERSGASSNPQKLANWLSQIKVAGGGGNDGEAVEAALEIIATTEDFDVVLLAGDEPSNSKESLRAAGKLQTLQAIDFAKRLGDKQVPVHCFSIGEDQRTHQDFEELARASGGKAGKLDGTIEMTDLAVLAILDKTNGKEAVQDYLNEHNVSEETRKFGQLLLGDKS